MMSFSCSVFTLTTLILLSGVLDHVSASMPSPSNDLVVYALPVGQGDCTVIQCPRSSGNNNHGGNIVLMDCGTSSRQNNQFSATNVESFLGNQINKVVAIMITHPDRDHFNYIPAIGWNGHSIKAVIIGGEKRNYYRRNNNEFQAIHNFLTEAEMARKLYTISNGQKCVGNCAVNNIGTNFCDNNNIKFHILAANINKRSNEKSIVMKIVVGQWSMLLSGDMEGSGATQIARSLGPALQSTVYKMSHHGASSKANRITWLKPIKPLYAFASSGYNHGNNRHPRCDAVKRLLSLGTIRTASSHRFYCGNARNRQPTLYNNFQEHIYETSPRANEMCILGYYSSGYFQQECTTVRVVQERVQEELESVIQDIYTVLNL